MPRTPCLPDDVVHRILDLLVLEPRTLSRRLKRRVDARETRRMDAGHATALRLPLYLRAMSCAPTPAAFRLFADLRPRPRPRRPTSRRVDHRERCWGRNPDGLRCPDRVVETWIRLCLTCSRRRLSHPVLAAPTFRAGGPQP